METEKRILLSCYEKNEELARFACGMYELDWDIISSGGTKAFLEGKCGIATTDTAEITGLKPVLDHRVATLCPQLHGGLLAEERHMEELGRLGWPRIDAVAVTFYPLAEEMAKMNATRARINEKVDIGGPTLVRSACKGGRIVLVNERDFEPTLELLKAGQVDEEYIVWLQAVAAATITQYLASESLFRTRQTCPTVLFSE